MRDSPVTHVVVIDLYSFCGTKRNGNILCETGESRYNYLATY